MKPLSSAKQFEILDPPDDAVLQQRRDERPRRKRDKVNGHFLLQLRVKRGAVARFSSCLGKDIAGRRKPSLYPPGVWPTKPADAHPQELDTESDLITICVTQVNPLSKAGVRVARGYVVGKAHAVPARIVLGKERSTVLF